MHAVLLRWNWQPWGVISRMLGGTGAGSGRCHAFRGEWIPEVRKIGAAAKGGWIFRGERDD